VVKEHILKQTHNTQTRLYEAHLFFHEHIGTTKLVNFKIDKVTINTSPWESIIKLISHKCKHMC
jgi:hypothetical protein